jgi:hypothetical protein
MFTFRGTQAGRPVTYGTLAAVLFGLGLRTFYYLQDPSVWHDEAAMILNVLGKGFGELLGPLYFFEAAPPLFLWLERGVSLVLGDGTYALRLVPFLAGCLSLVLFARLARYWLPAASVPWAVLLFACSDRLLWHACEAKPYSVDLLLATLVLSVYTHARAWPLGRQVLLWTALTPGLVFLSYPGCFLCGGLLTGLAVAVWRARSGRLWLGYGLWAAVTATCFLLLLGPIRAQHSEEMRSCWTDRFPEWERPWSVPLWAVTSTADVVHYTCNPVGEYLAFLVFVGAVAFWRRGERTLVVLLTVPWSLALLASCLGAYPYGGVRVLVYTAPAVLLLLGAGLPDTFAWLRRRNRLVAYGLVVLLVFPLGNTLYRVVRPWNRADAAGAASYVYARRAPGETVCGCNWEYGYYFRRQPGALVPPQGGVPDPARPLWEIVTTATEQEREEFLRQVAEGRPTLERHDFALTTVVHLAPVTAPPATGIAQR